MAQPDNAADSDSEERGFESLRAGQKIITVPLWCRCCFLVYNQTKGFEQGGSAAEENSPVDCFRRRGEVASVSCGQLSERNDAQRSKFIGDPSRNEFWEPQEVERSEAINAVASDKIPSSGPKSNGAFWCRYFFYLTFAGK